MFKKVLIVEDIDSVNTAVAAVLNELEVPICHHAQYCDNAFNLFKKAQLEEAPYDLLICDLSFKVDHREQRIHSGKELAKILKEEDPDLRILINSVEDHPHYIRRLWDTGCIDGFVCKDRKGMKDLKEAIHALYEGKTYNSPQIEMALQQNAIIHLSDYEITLLRMLERGFTMDDVQAHFKKNQISPYSKSSLEKKLKDLKDDFEANTTLQLICMLKDLRLI